MAYTTTELITDAYYLSSVRAQGFETVSGAELSQGLKLLNDLLSIKTANNSLIPYYTQYDFNAIQNQEKYFIPNLIDVETFVFYISSVRYATQPQSRREYFGSARAENIASLPYNWHYERTKGGANFFMYFLPQSDYPCTIWGKFSLSNVVLGQDLSLTLDQYYLTYLRYGLAEYIADNNNITLPPGASSKLRELESVITDISPMDLTIRKTSTLQTNAAFNYADVNIGHGWRP